MSERLERQYVVSRRPYGGSDAADKPFRPWKVFDARATARAFCKAKVARSNQWQYAIDPVTRGPHA